MNIVLALRWIARISGAGLVLLIGTFVFAEGVPDVTKFSTTESILMGALVMMCLGLLLAYKFEAVGGLMLLAGYTTFVVGNSRINWFLTIFPLIGCLYLYVWSQSRLTRNKS